MVRHIPNHSSKSQLHQRYTFKTKLCLRHYLNHNSKSQLFQDSSHSSKKNSYFQDFLSHNYV